MMIKLSTILLSTFLLISGAGYTQSANTSRKEALEIKKRVLLVAIPTGGNKKSKERFKALVEKYWTFNERIEYASTTKVKKLMKEDKTKYALLTYRLFTETAIRSTRNPLYSPRNRTMQSMYTKESYVANTIASLVISLNRKKAHVKTNLSANYSLERNTIYGLMQLQYLLNYLVESPKHKSLATFYRKQIKKNAPLLQTKTLLLDKELISKKLNVSKIRDYYPFPYQIADASTIDKALEERNDQYAFIHVANVDAGRGAINIQFISSAKDGKIYLYVAPRPFSMTGINGIKFNQFHKIGKKQLKRYAKKAK